MKKVLEIAALLPQRACTAIKQCETEAGIEIEEIRIKANSAVSVVCKGQIFYVTKSGSLCRIQNNPILLSQQDIHDVFLKLCKTSVYAKEQEISNGFVTYQGCRCGLYGKAVVGEQGEMQTFSQIEGINIRIAKECKNCSLKFLAEVVENRAVLSTLLVSPPCGGKTTMLRDLAAQLSKLGKRVVVIDERGELSGDGGFDLGANSQVLAGINKAFAMELAVRTLNPSVIMIDEIGSMEEIDNLLGAINTGVPIIASAHARGMRDLILRPQFNKLYHTNAIEKVIVLDGERLGQIKNIYDLRGKNDENFGSDFDNSVLLWDIRNNGAISTAKT